MADPTLQGVYAGGSPTIPGETVTSGSPSFSGVTAGWWLLMAVVVANLTAYTIIGPISVGIIGVALIYQLNLLIQGK